MTALLALPDSRSTIDQERWLDSWTRATPVAAVELVTLPVHASDELALLALAQSGEPLVYWAPEHGPAVSGTGAALRLSAAGPERFRTLAAQTTAIELAECSYADTSPLGARYYGGFAFRAGAVSERWRAFGEASFVLPRLTLARSGDRLWLTRAVRAEENRAAAAEELRRVAERLAGVPTAGPCAVTLGGRSEAPARDAYLARVETARAAIGAGAYEKIVLARQSTLELREAPSLRAVLGGLGRQGATRFAFGYGDRCFVGATPEHLIERRGRRVRSEALAGSIGRDTPDAEAALIGSLKDHSEHGFVVEYLRERLAPLCRSLKLGTAPRILQLAHLLHLKTDLLGELASPAHVLEVVERLHPTPAVGGAPAEAALAALELLEPEERGWYASPVGWVAPDGDGELCVALRSALLGPQEIVAYAGAGIVAASSPQAEWEETQTKLRTVLAALGVDDGEGPARVTSR